MRKSVKIGMLLVIISMIIINAVQEHRLREMNKQLDSLQAEYKILQWSYNQTNPYLSEDCERGYDCKETMEKP